MYILKLQIIWIYLTKHGLTKIPYLQVPEFFGTRVTKENFLEWRRKFVLERNCNKVVIETDKLSGRQIFNLKGAEAMKIEVELLSNEGLLGDEEDVEVDESLFNEIEDFSDSEEESGWGTIVCTVYNILVVWVIYRNNFLF